MKKGFLLILLIVIAGCSQVKKVDLINTDESTVEVSVHNVNEHWEIIDDSPVALTDRETVKLFVKALSNVEQQPGVVDIAAPHYVIYLNRDQFYLWIREDGGSIMKPEDTNTLYTLEEEIAKEIYEIFKEEITPYDNLSNGKVLSSLKKQGLELKEALRDVDSQFGKELNGEWPEAYELDEFPVYLYNFYSITERQKGLKEWRQNTSMQNLESYHVFEVENVLIFFINGNEAYTDIHEKFVEGLKDL